MYTSVLSWLVPFTKAQRLKGLKKQLRNLGYSVTANKDASDFEAEPESDVDSGGRGAKTVAALRARDEAW